MTTGGGALTVLVGMVVALGMLGVAAAGPNPGVDTTVAVVVLLLWLVAVAALVGVVELVDRARVALRVVDADINRWLGEQDTT